jgi:hypothetical protein
MIPPVHGFVPGKLLKDTDEVVRGCCRRRNEDDMVAWLLVGDMFLLSFHIFFE